MLSITSYKAKWLIFAFEHNRYTLYIIQHQPKSSHNPPRTVAAMRIKKAYEKELTVIAVNRSHNDNHH